MQRGTKLKWLVTLALVLLSATVGALLVQQSWQPAPERAAEVAVETAPALQGFQLYFLDAAGTHLVPETRELPVCREENECVGRLFAALAEGPQNPALAPVLPHTARVLGVRQEAGVVIADFSRELASQHPGGSLSELMTVYALADTMAANFPHLRQLTILLEGQAVETLKGHVALGQPIGADFQYSRPPALPEPKPARPGAERTKG